MKWILTIAALAALTVAGAVRSADAQAIGSNTLDAEQAGSSVWSSSVGSFCSFEIEAKRDILLRNVASRGRTSNWEIWARMITAPSMGATPPSNGWSNLGTTTNQVQSSSTNIIYIPIDLQLRINQGERYQIAVIPTQNTSYFYRWPNSGAGPAQEAQNADIILSGFSFRSTYSGSNTPPWSSSFTGWAFGGAVSYDTELVEPTLNGPVPAETVPTNSAGPNGNGELLADVTIDPTLGQPTVNSLTFTASGTGDDSTAFSSLALYEDTDGDGVPSPGDTLATAATGNWAGDDDEYQAMLSDTSLMAARRFFLMGTLNGTAMPRQTFKAALTDIGTAPTVGVSGLPTIFSDGLITEAPAISVRNAETNATTVYANVDGTETHYVGSWEVMSDFGMTSVTDLSLTLEGNGDWMNSVGSGGIALYLDDGDGLFDAGIDTPIGDATGATSPAVITLTSPLAIAPNGSEMVHVVLTVGATEGSSLGDEYRVTIAAEGDVTATSNAVVMFSNGESPTASLTVVDFFIDEITPATSLPSGGTPLEITGSGFSAPFELYINDTLCAGTAEVSPDGTMVTGIFAPPYESIGLVSMRINMPSTIGEVALEQEFRYVAPPATNDCSYDATQAGLPVGLLILLVTIGGLALVRSRRS